MLQRNVTHQFLSGGHSDAAPPDPIPNSEVKRISGDGSLGSPHARVAHCQTPNTKKGHLFQVAFFYVRNKIAIKACPQHTQP
jgi:hypothetical protein